MLDKESELKIEKLQSQLKNEHKKFFQFLVHFVKETEKRDKFMIGHSSRVAHYAMSLAKSIGLSSQEVQDVAYAGVLHDIGNVTLPLEIFQKVGILIPQELMVVKQHPSLGAQYLQSTDLFENVLPAVLTHHERWDGNGYPEGLKGEEIPISGRIVFVAEAFDAMTTARPFRTAKNFDVAKKNLIDNKNLQFDAKLVDAFVKLIDTKKI